MKIRIEINEELKSRLRKAQTAEEAYALLKRSGADAPLAEQIWKELCAHRGDEELSLDELEAVAGGADRNWVTDGCAATVEPGSRCGSNDACWKWDVTYDNEPTTMVCPVCGKYLYLEETEFSSRPSDDVAHYRCVCGYTKVV